MPLQELLNMTMIQSFLLEASTIPVKSLDFFLLDDEEHERLPVAIIRLSALLP